MREPTVPCMWCGKPTTMLGTKHCDRCHELDVRIRMDKDIASKILAHYEKEAEDGAREIRTAYIEDENGRQTEAMLHVSMVADEIPASAVLEAEIGPDLRSEWRWIRMQNGDLILGTYPRGELYEEISEALPI